MKDQNMKMTRWASPSLGKRQNPKKMSRLRFNRKIYPIGAVKKALLAYAHLIDLKLQLGADYVEVYATNKTAGKTPILLDEFANYVLGMAIK